MTDKDKDLPFGITPAWAGKSSSVRVAMVGFWDHPRVGGEKTPRRSSMNTVRGSPPRGRGKVLEQATSLTAPRITPAWAGKSFSITARGRVRRDHPRVGGEKT